MKNNRMEGSMSYGQLRAGGSCVQREERAEFRTEEKQVHRQPLSQTTYLLPGKSRFTAL